VFKIEHILPYSMWHVCPQLGVSFFADSNSWNVNGTSNLRTVKLRVLSQQAPDNVLAQPRIPFFSWVVKNQASSTKFSIFKSMATW